MKKERTYYDSIKIVSDSMICTWVSFTKLCSDLNDGYIIVWQHHHVFVGRITKGLPQWGNNYEPIPHEEHFIRIRAFNNDEEYHFWRTSEGLTGRLRKDGRNTEKQNEINVVETDMEIRGIAATQLKFVEPDFADAEKIGIRTRNYICQDGQASYVDNRFVKFTKN